METNKVLKYRIRYFNENNISVCSLDPDSCAAAEIQLSLDLASPDAADESSREVGSFVSVEGEDVPTHSLRGTELPAIIAKLGSIRGIVSMQTSRYRIRLTRESYVATWDEIIPEVIDVICQHNGYTDSVIDVENNKQGSPVDQFLRDRKPDLERMARVFVALFQQLHATHAGGVTLDIKTGDVAIVAAALQLGVNLVSK